LKENLVINYPRCALKSLLKKLKKKKMDTKKRKIKTKIRTITMKKKKVVHSPRKKKKSTKIFFANQQMKCQASIGRFKSFIRACAFFLQLVSQKP